MTEASKERKTQEVPCKGIEQERKAPRYGAEPEVWTERMLTALEEGVKGGKWHSLIDKVIRKETLELGWQKVKRNRGSAGVDGVTVERFERRKEKNLTWLEEQLKAGTYQPEAVKRVEIPKERGKTRPLGIPVVRDRVVQNAIRMVIEPIFEKEFSERSYGFRPGRKAQEALRRVDELLKQGYRYIVDADIKEYFNTIPHEPLMKLVAKHIADGRVLDLIEEYLNQRIMSGMKVWKPTQGTPQGAIISPLLANIYLHPLDKQLEELGYEETRFADDFVIQCRSQQEAEQALETVKLWMAAAGLELHPGKTKIANLTETGSFEFLGYRFERKQGRDFRWPREKSIAKLRDAVRSHTPRTSGRSLEQVIGNVNRVVRGWFNYFKHAHRNSFPDQDKWIRQRLRAILKKRRKRPGCPKGADFQRWPNEFFHTRGLFSMVRARRELGYA